MTTDDRPTPPTELDRAGRDALRTLVEQDAATLRAVGSYLEALAAWKERRDADASEPEPAAAEYPDGVPDRASVSVTEIAGTEYYYYQWREGDEIRSETVRR